MRHPMSRPRPLALFLAVSIALARSPVIAAEPALAHPIPNASSRAALPPWWPAARKRAPTARGNVIPVGICADSGGGTLRAAAAAAVDGDTIDMSQLTCGTITLTTGAVVLNARSVTLRGPANRTLTITATSEDGILRQPGGSTLALYDLTLADGAANSYVTPDARGGCIYAGGDVSLTNVVVRDCATTAATDNRASIDGGGVWAGGLVTLTGSRISGSRSAAFATGTPTVVGAGVYAGGGLVMTSSTLDDNRAYASYGSYGGGAFVRGDAYVLYSTISRNESGKYEGSLALSGNVGGITVVDAFRTSVFNSTISGNYATGSIGGMYSDADGFDTTIFDSTIAFNHARDVSAYGAGLHVPGSVNVLGSILANNDAGGTASDLAAGVVTGNNNLIMASSVYRAGTITSDPQLGPLQDNGGPTATHALSANSPAISTGFSFPVTTYDQRGFPYSRVFGAATDIGAFELQPRLDVIFANGFD